MEDKTVPLVSVIIATFHSEKVLSRTLQAIREQNYLQDKIEILIIDGGSKDRTLEIAKEYGCEIYPNPYTDPVHAKLIGMQNAKGKYVVTIDHDEVMQNRNSIQAKVRALESHPECKVALCSGYERPRNYPLLNQYISDFGDPFSLFIYRFPKDHMFFERAVRRDCVTLFDNRDYCVVSFRDRKRPVIMELCCLGTMIEREYFSRIPGALEDGAVFTQLFYIMLERGTQEVVLMREDPLLHYSVDSFKAYLPKLKWRVVNNIHFQDQGNNGFNGRIRYQDGLNVKKYFFPIYSVTLFPVLFDGIYYCFSRKNPVYLLHGFFSLYVTFQIVYQYILKFLHKTPAFTSYDGKKVIR